MKNSMLCCSLDEALSVLRSGVLQMAVAIHLSIAFSNKFEILTCANSNNFLNLTLYLELLLVAGSHPFKDKISLYYIILMKLRSKTLNFGGVSKQIQGPVHGRCDFDLVWENGQIHRYCPKFPLCAVGPQKVKLH